MLIMINKRLLNSMLPISISWLLKNKSKITLYQSSNNYIIIELKSLLLTIKLAIVLSNCKPTNNVYFRPIKFANVSIQYFCTSKSILFLGHLKNIINKKTTHNMKYNLHIMIQATKNGYT